MMCVINLNNLDGSVRSTIVLDYHHPRMFLNGSWEWPQVIYHDNTPYYFIEERKSLAHITGDYQRGPRP